MKKIFALMAIAAVGFVSCSKDDGDEAAPTNPTGPTPLTVEKKNRAAVIYFGEDWCPPCGSYGGPTLDSLLSQEGTLLTGIKINSSSNNNSLNWSPGNGMYSAFNTGVFNSASTIPAMAVNQLKNGVTTSIGSNYNSAITKSNTFAAAPVIAGIALRKSITGDSISVETKVKFYNATAANEDYRLAVYIVEDEVVASQSTSTSGTVANYVHSNMVRTANAGSYTGVAINNLQAITADQEFSNTYKIYLKPAWNKDKLKVVAVLWKMGTTPATLINSNVLK